MLEKNKQFGRLIVGKEVQPPVDVLYSKRVGKWYECRCKCGNIKICSEMSLKNGSVSSCGCYKSEYMRNTIAKKRETMARNGNTTAPKTKIVKVAIDGKEKSISEWAKELGVSRQCLSKRLKKYPTEKAFEICKKGDK